MDFLEELAVEVRPEAEKDLRMLEEYKAKHTGIVGSLKPWDVAYYTAIAKHARCVPKLEILKGFVCDLCLVTTD